jgi:hypothetical protein
MRLDGFRLLLLFVYPLDRYSSHSGGILASRVEVYATLTCPLVIAMFTIFTSAAKSRERESAFN